MEYNYVICDDTEFFLNLMAKTVEESAKSKGFKYSVYKFGDYDDEFFKITYKHMPNKIYILDIEAPSGTGIDAAIKIREFDNESTIIYVSAYENEYLRHILKSDTSYFCSIYKADLKHSLKIKLNKLYKKMSNKIIKIRVDDDLYSVTENDIFYIEAFDRKSIVVTKHGKIETNYILNEIYKLLSTNFVYSHKACIVNKNKILNYSVNNKIINFVNGISTDLISRKFVENLENKEEKIIN